MGEARIGGGSLKSKRSPQNKESVAYSCRFWEALVSTALMVTGGVQIAEEDSRSPNVSVYVVVCYRKRIKYSSSIKGKIYISTTGCVTARGQERLGQALIIFFL